MELRQDLILVDVRYEGKKATLIFLDEEREEVREVNFNKQVYDTNTNTYIDSPEKEEQVTKWCNDYFGVDFERLADCVGMSKNIYIYDTFNSLWEIDMVQKFKDEDLGLVDSAVIKQIVLDNIGIRIRIDYEGKMYEAKMSYSEYLEGLKKYVVNPQKKAKQFEKFSEKFGVSIEDKDELIGKEVMFEVKKAMGKYIYIDIKGDKKKKKK